MSRSSYPLSPTCFIFLGQKCETTGGYETSGEIYAGIFTNCRFKIPKHNREMMKEKKRNHLTLELKYFIVQEKARKPYLLILKSINDVIFDVN